MFLNPSVRMAILRLVSEVKAKGSKPLWWKRLPITLFFVVVLLVVSGSALTSIDRSPPLVLLGGILLILALVVAVIAFVVALAYLAKRREPERTVDQKLPDEPLG